MMTRMDRALARGGYRWLVLATLTVLVAVPAVAQDGADPPAQGGSTTASDRPGFLRLFPRAVGGRLRQTVPLSSLFVPSPVKPLSSTPGSPTFGTRPRPGSRFDPGAGGPGISQNGDQNFLDGALDSNTGWPFVFLDHYRPRPERLGQLWVVSSRDCPQVLGSDPWPKLKAFTFDAEGQKVERPFAELFAAAGSRPVVVQVQGNMTTPDAAFGGLIWTHSWLQHHRALSPDAVVIAFDWPSERIYGEDLRDTNEKGRRAFVAAYHLAVFVAAFPSGSRIGLIGQSFGGRVVAAALHLGGGGELHGRGQDGTARLAATRPDLRVRAVVIAAAVDRTWLDPGQKLDRVLLGCDSLLNLYNRRDEALLLYPSLIRSGHHRAIGRVGLSNSDFAKLGPLAARYHEFDIHDDLGPEHTLLDAVANPEIARRIAPYVWSPDPGAGPPARHRPGLFGDHPDGG